MNQFSRWKNTPNSVDSRLCCILCATKFLCEAPAVQIMPIKSGEKMDPIVASQSEKILEENNISYNGVVLTENYIKIKLNNNEDQLTSKGLLEDKLGSNFVVALNLLPNSPKWLESIGGQPMYLGLDLRGGVHFLMQVDLSNIEAKESSGRINEIRTLLRENKIRYDQISVENGLILVQLTNESDLKKSKNILLQDDSSSDFSQRINIGGSIGKEKIRDITDNGTFILAIEGSQAK